MEKWNLLRIARTTTTSTTSSTMASNEDKSAVGTSPLVQLPYLNSCRAAYQSARVCTESKLTLYLLGTQGPLLREH